MPAARAGQFLPLLFCLIITVQASQAQGHSSSKPKHVDREVVVKFTEDIADVLTKYGHVLDLTDGRRLGGVRGLYHLRSKSKDTPTLIQDLAALPEVIYAEPNFTLHAVDIPNDPSFPQLWGLQNTGQSFGFPSGMAGADISAVAAWDITTGGQGHVVGVVDTGVDYTHPDLEANMWSAPFDFTISVGGRSVACPSGTHGFNAIAWTCDPMDDYMHGTHVAGTIGAAGNNSMGVVGVNWTTQIMALKFLGSDGWGTLADAINAIEFAVQIKGFFARAQAADIRVLSNSWGGGGVSQALLDEINRAGSSDMLFVVAAGNNSSDLAQYPTYPASYNSASMIVVAATDNNDALASFSNFGSNAVHLGAPGVDILSTTPAGTYSYLSGTSMATPHVSGAAELVLSACNLTTAELKAVLLENVDPLPSLAGLTSTGGRLNVNRAVRSCSGPATLSPGLLSFGTVAVGKTSAARYATLRNNQSVALNITSISVSSDFAQTNTCGSILAPQASCTISINFVPLLAGAKQGQLQVVDDAPNTPRTVSLVGSASDGADLLITAPTASTYAASPGSSGSATFTVVNQGNASASPSIAAIYLSTTAVKGGTALALASIPVPVLPADASSTTLADFTIPGTIARGTYYLIACADDTNLVLEIEETNNCAATSPIQVQLADLSETSAVPGAAISGAGEALQVTDTAANLSAVSAPASTTQYYLSWATTKANGSRVLSGSRTVSQLPGGATSTGTVMVTIPPDMPAGSYFLLACADDTNLLVESNENNNCVASANRIQIGPDLVETGLTLGSSKAGAGGTLQITETALNQGGGSSSAFEVQYYLSTYTTKTTSARLLAPSRPIPLLSAGTSSTATAAVIVPSDVVTGAYYVLACADGKGTVSEINENNNCIASPTRVAVGPDLVETNLTLGSTKASAGGTLQIGDTVVNAGGGDAGASLTRYYISGYTAKTGSAQLLNGARSIPSINAGAISIGTAVVTVPPAVTTGSYYVLACADDTALIAEIAETNNCAVSSARLQVGPDLAVSSITAAATKAGAGGSLQVTDATINQGGGDAPESTTRYYFSVYASRTSAARLLGSRLIGVLPAGITSSGAANITLPIDVATGTYFLIACADDTNSIVETSETNNCATSGSRVSVGSDLIVSFVSSGAALVSPGGLIPVTDTSSNQGGGDAGPSQTRYYFSPYPSKTSSSRLLSGGRVVPALAAGTNSSGSATVGIPADMVLGTYYLLACADDTDALNEVNETNNCSAANTRVSVSAP